MTIPNLERHIYGDHDMMPSVTDRTDEDPQLLAEADAEAQEIAKEEADELKLQEQRDQAVMARVEFARRRNESGAR